MIICIHGESNILTLWCKNRVINRVKERNHILHCNIYLSKPFPWIPSSLPFCSCSQPGWVIFWGIYYVNVKRVLISIWELTRILCRSGSSSQGSLQSSLQREINGHTLMRKHKYHWRAIRHQQCHNHKKVQFIVQSSISSWTQYK